jgi:hypothetical protein
LAISTSREDGTDESLILWDVEQAQEIWIHDNLRNFFDFSQDSAFLVYQDVHISKIIGTKPGTPRIAIPWNGLGPTPFLFSKDSKLLVNWETQDVKGKKLNFLEKWLGFEQEKSVGVVIIRELETGNEIARLETAPDVSVSFSDDRKILVTTHSKDPKAPTKIHCWDLPLRKPLELVLGVPLAIGALAFLVNWWFNRKKKRPGGGIKAPAVGMTPGPEPEKVG